ncbi:MAG TPA: hypothetical protein VGW34_03815 [Allosphingosinicella sp.]|nr:hypothetical protein [Allosphingosinicella sp.]
MGNYIVLTSQPVDGSEGFNLHGVFPSIASAVRHIAKDADLGPIRMATLLEKWGVSPEPRKETVQLGEGDRQELWVANLCPLRGEDGS